MIGKKMTEALNVQINKELYSAYLYLSMSAYAATLGLKGFANWLAVQVKEEMIHAEKFFNYVNQKNAVVTLKGIEEPPVKFGTPLEMFEKVLAHEVIVTTLINDLVKLSRDEKDYATEAFLQWFVTEQVEEEANATDVIQKLQIVGKDPNGLLTIDAQLGTRILCLRQRVLRRNFEGRYE